MANGKLPSGLPPNRKKTRKFVAISVAVARLKPTTGLVSCYTIYVWRKIAILTNQDEVISDKVKQTKLFI